MKNLLVSIATIMAFCAADQAVAQEGESAMAEEAYVYKTVGERELKMHVSFPPDWKETDQRPVIVFFFGGGWSGGSVKAFERQAAYFAGRGLVTARADYRIKSKDGVAPDKCVEDARSAVRWLRVNAGRLGIDPGKLITSGGSAGGHLAACALIPESVETDGDDLSVSTIPQAMVLFNPVLDLTHERIINRLDGDMELARKISPALHLSADVPPAIILFGSEDKLKVHGDLYWEKAEELGLRADKYIAEGAGHGFFNNSPWLERTMIEADKFLASLGYLEGEPTIQVPTGEELEALKAEQRERKARQKARRKEAGS
jgi:acetyl esterase